MPLLKPETLVPPMSMGRNVSEEEWNRIFPKQNPDKQQQPDHTKIDKPASKD